MTDEQIAYAAKRWLSEIGLTWQALALEISPSLRGFSLKRRCVLKGYIPKVAKGFERCYCCKKVKPIDQFYSDHITCMTCVDKHTNI